ncbi:MAG: anthranilate phosphoribosyltransferase [Bacteroidales bacterium]|nr:anthranilate phosphoribosyltransferase [Bacteroidales bacterium]
MKIFLERLYRQEHLGREEAKELLQAITAGQFSEVQVASLLTVFRMRDITADELLGFREALLEQAVKVDFPGIEALDIVGTGGDGKDTFNISTCAAFVIAGAGQPVIKHGNHAASSVSGASTVLESHGVRFTTDVEQLRRSVAESGFAYLHAPLFHPALATVAPLRRSIGVRTIFNLLGPLVNPARPAFQLLGVADLAQMRLYTIALQKLGVQFATVTSVDGYDEISLTSDFKVMSNHSEHIYRPVDLGLPLYEQSELYGGTTKEEAAMIFSAVLQGTATEAQRNVVLVNAALGLQVARPALSLSACFDLARHALESGRALQAFQRFVAINQ